MREPASGRCPGPRPPRVRARIRYRFPWLGPSVGDRGWRGEVAARAGRAAPAIVGRDDGFRGSLVRLCRRVARGVSLASAATAASARTSKRPSRPGAHRAPSPPCACSPAARRARRDPARPRGPTRDAGCLAKRARTALAPRRPGPRAGSARFGPSGRAAEGRVPPGSEGAGGRDAVAAHPASGIGWRPRTGAERRWGSARGGRAEAQALSRSGHRRPRTATRRTGRRAGSAGFELPRSLDGRPSEGSAGNASSRRDGAPPAPRIGCRPRAAAVAGRPGGPVAGDRARPAVRLGSACAGAARRAARARAGGAGSCPRGEGGAAARSDTAVRSRASDRASEGDRPCSSGSPISTAASATSF